MKCPSCGMAVPGDVPTCDCGFDLTSVRTEEPHSDYGWASAESGRLRYRLSPKRIVLLSVLSADIYLYYWFYVTWRQYRDLTGKQVYPIWHAFTVAIPIYGYFRTHAHMWELNELMHGRGVSAGISPRWAVGCIVALSAISVASLLAGSGDITAGIAAAMFVLSLATVAITVGLLLYAQGILNRYWDSLGTSHRLDAGIETGEIIVAIIGGLSWTLPAMALLSESLQPV